MQKVLSLCFPTYNRGWCIKEQIIRLQGCPLEILDKIEILISDNCSTDDTQEIVENAISQGFSCTYIRNETNLGMDGNFVSCFRKAKGTYVWLLGDDDYLLPSSLGSIIDVLTNDIEYGLAHIYCKQERFSNEPFVLYKDKMLYARTISYYTTFISANIVNTKYVPKINFEKYMGTWFTLLPLYITAFIQETNNILINIPVFESPKDTKRNGGYNYFEVFVNNYLGIWKEFYTLGVVDRKTYNFIKRDSFDALILDHIYSFLIKTTKLNYSTNNGWKYIFNYYGLNMYLYSGMLRYGFKLLALKMKSYFKK